MNIELVLPQNRETEEQIEGLCSARLEAFAPETKSFIADLSKHLLVDSRFRPHPELIALGYWFRPSALRRLEESHTRLRTECLLRPRGVVLHFAPANVDTIFVYSWLLSLLCGNRNIVRISQRGDSSRQALLLQIIAELLADPRHSRIAQATAVIRFDHDDTLTEKLSNHCHLRVVWGGDAAVRAIRKIPLPPLATELNFANRTSWALIRASVALSAKDKELARQAEALANDIFWFSQQACSSPRALLWIGCDEEIEAAKERFWPVLYGTLARRREGEDPSELSARILAAHLAAAEPNVNLRLETPLPTRPLRMHCDLLTAAMRENHPGHGLIYELARPSLSETGGIFSAQDQTIAYWGFSRTDLSAWLTSLSDRALDRLVPLGQALAFSETWDGNSLLQSFSRRTEIL